MARAKLKNEQYRKLYELQAAFLRRLTAWLRIETDEQWIPLIRAAREEVRTYLRYVVEDRRPVPPMPNVERLGKVSGDVNDAAIMDWNDRVARAEHR